MAKTGILSHLGSDGRGPSERVGYGVSENVAYAHFIDIAHESLVNSPGHYANMIKDTSTRVGLGIAKGQRIKDALYVT